MTFIVHVEDNGRVAMLGLNGMNQKTNGWKNSRNVGAAIMMLTQATFDHYDTLMAMLHKSLMIVQLVRCVKSMEIV